MRIGTGKEASTRELAAETGFDPDVIETVRSVGTIDPKVVRFETADPNSVQGDPYFAENQSLKATPVPGDAEALEKIVHDYPELRGSVSPKKTVQPVNLLRFPADQASEKKFKAQMLKTNPEFFKELERRRAIIGRRVFHPPDNGKADGRAIIFFVKEEGWNYLEDCWNKVEQLQNKLKPHGYQVYSIGSKFIISEFTAKQDALNFVNRYTSVKNGNPISYDPPFSREVIFNPALTPEQRYERLFGTLAKPKYPSEDEVIAHACGISNTEAAIKQERARFRACRESEMKIGRARFDTMLLAVHRRQAYSNLGVPRGATIEKLGTDRWRITTPARWSVWLHPSRIVLFKGMDQFLFLTFARSNPLITLTDNYELPMKLLNDLDQSYGIDILEYDGQVVQAELNKLPEDLKSFADRLYRFRSMAVCGKLPFDEHADFERKCADELKKNRRFSVKLQ